MMTFETALDGLEHLGNGQFFHGSLFREKRHNLNCEIQRKEKSPIESPHFSHLHFHIFFLCLRHRFYRKLSKRQRANFQFIATP